MDPRPLEVVEMGNGLDWSRVVGRKRRCKDGCEEAKEAGGALSRWEQMGWLEGGCCRGWGWIAHRSVGLTAVWLSLAKWWKCVSLLPTGSLC